MVPIHDTDIAENRWTQAEWHHYELWEKVEHRLKRRKWVWISLTAVLFLALSAVPVVVSHWPKWSSLRATSRLGQEINRIKTDANIQHQAFRLRFASERPEFIVEKASSCSDAVWSPVRSGSLFSQRRMDDFVLLSPQQGLDLNIPGLSQSFCYDYLSGSDVVLRGETVVGFAIVPVKDLAEQKIHRMSLLLLTGPSAEISFD